MSKLKRAWLATRYFIVNGIFAGAIYFGFFAEMNGGTNIDGAANLALFIAWLTGVLALLIGLGLVVDSLEGERKGQFREAFSRNEPSMIPFWFDLLFDISVTMAFVWSGYIWVSLFYVLSIFIGKTLRDIPKNMVLNKLKSQQS